MQEQDESDAARSPAVSGDPRIHTRTPTHATRKQNQGARIQKDIRDGHQNGTESKHLKRKIIN